MTNVPFLYVNLTALCLYVLMLCAFSFAKKTPEIKAFITVLICFILWVGGSVMMRLQIFPGVTFWFYVSIVALFSIAALLYVFVCRFVDAKAPALTIVWSAGTVVILILTVLGVFISPPTVQTRPGGGAVFLYDMNWLIIVPCVFFLAIVVSIIKLFRDTVKNRGHRYPGLMSIIIGCIAIALGNMMQLIPGNIFPCDTLSGIVFAVMLMLALYRKRMFKMTLLFSRSILIAVPAVICVVMTVYFVDPIERILTSYFKLSGASTTTIIVAIFAVALGLTYAGMTKLVDRIFTRDEEQSRLLKKFSKVVSKTLSTEEIMIELVSIINSEIAVKNIFVCLPDENCFVPKHCLDKLSTLNFTISADSPLIKYLTTTENHVMIHEFRRDPLYMSMWNSEKDQLRALDISCAVALKDGEEITGLILLTAKGRGNSITPAELDFMSAVSSVASIAVKNAALYERVFREARVDNLTGVYNYKYFVERVELDYAECRDDCIALMFLDLDDFKLYNQLYGTEDGDYILKTVASIITLAVGTKGTVYRYSGKVFAVLLPHCDGHDANTMAVMIQKQLLDINRNTGRGKKKLISSSYGICVSPHSASSSKELVENADLATFNAKLSGKSRIVLFKNGLPQPNRIAERAADIVERSKGRNDTNYRIYNQTVFALTAAIDAKDHYTYNHSNNVARYSSILATAAGLNESQILLIYEAALLHDIGKISIPESILSKETSLSDDEYEVMKGHVNSSIEMIRHLPSMEYLIPATVGHHERWDGKGYPRGLKGEDIPISARCLAIADSFDAMTTDRPYRKGLSVEYASEQLESGAGTQFDPELSLLFVRLIREGEIKTCSPDHEAQIV